MGSAGEQQEEQAGRVAADVLLQRSVEGVRRVLAAWGRARLGADEVRVRLPGEDAAPPEAAPGGGVAEPLVHEGASLGVLEVARGPGRAPFDAREREALRGLAPVVAAALERLQREASLRAAHDALERRAAEADGRATRSEREWAATFDGLADPLVVLDGHRVRRANRRYLSLVGGRALSDVVGAPCYEVLARRSSPCPGCPLKAGGAATEVRFDELAFQATATTLELPEGPAQLVAYRDVSRQAQLAERLREGGWLASVGQLASGAAHEINNPLSFVLANLRALRDTVADVMLPATEARRVAVEAVQRGDTPAALAALARAPLEVGEIADALQVIDEAVVGAQRIHAVVSSLKELSRQQKGRLEPLEVNRLVEQAAARVLGAQHQARLELRSAVTVPVLAPQLERALDHVLRNARQASPSDADLTLRTRDEGGAVVIEVEDRGCGIPREHLPHVFDPFFTTRRVGEGMGLGLTVTWGIVSRHGGSVEISSKVGEGTTVRLSLPLNPAQLAEVSSAAGQGLGRYGERRRDSGSFRIESP